MIDRPGLKMVQGSLGLKPLLIGHPVIIDSNMRIPVFRTEKQEKKLEKKRRKKVIKQMKKDAKMMQEIMDRQAMRAICPWLHTY